MAIPAAAPATRTGSRRWRRHADGSTSRVITAKSAAPQHSDGDPPSRDQLLVVTLAQLIAALSGQASAVEPL